MSLTKFHYFRMDKSNEPGVITACTCIADDILYVSFAFCSPQDTFIKKTGRAKSLGRLKSVLERGENSPNCKYVFETTFSGNSYKDAVDVFNSHFNDLDKPIWCRDWRITYDEKVAKQMSESIG